ncbi:MAG: uncharacterized protein KVP18_001337 [Porospora cf. gigantea A]|uniref:uncharacterized protein n=1 Tax=Porospora cf. gigantea A TaxID=2853593 RepID=UPI0035598801|nr:MAG: hypothetical protein KVP18_001337 [Porospora cf. gigantea A]
MLPLDGHGFACGRELERFHVKRQGGTLLNDLLPRLEAVSLGVESEPAEVPFGDGSTVESEHEQRYTRLAHGGYDTYEHL